jgi:hypothetical protein
MQNPPPATGPLIDWLRDEAGAPFEAPRGDVGEQVALQWLPELAETDSRVVFAVEHLLAEGDRGITDRILHVATNAPMRRAVAAALPTAAPTLASVPAAGGFTELARAVFALRTLDGVPLSTATLRVLHDIDRSENGWPTSAAIGLANAPDDFLDLLGPAIAAATMEQMSEFASVLLGGDESALAKVLRAAGKQPDSQRDKLADAIKRELDTRDQSRNKLAAIAIALPPAESGHSRWQRYASLLAVAP